jgi:diguanylate cyclase (GGDEF)-like protein
MMDIDQFKQVNDAYGHGAGDAVLRELVKRLAANMRKTDVITRYGGDEFALLLIGMPIEESSRAVGRLLDAIRQDAFGVNGGNKLAVTVSAGVTQLLVDESPGQLVERADAALYQAKRDGRNRFTVAAADARMAQPA